MVSWEWNELQNPIWPLQFHIKLQSTSQLGYALSITADDGQFVSEYFNSAINSFTKVVLIH